VLDDLRDVPGNRRRSVKAGVVRGVKKAVVLEDRPIPDPGTGQAAVRIDASGLCHTDIHAANGDAPGDPGARQAYGSLRRGGTLVFVGLPADNEIRLPIFQTVLNGTKVVGSLVGARIDLQEVSRCTRPGSRPSSTRSAGSTSPTTRSGRSKRRRSRPDSSSTSPEAATRGRQRSLPGAADPGRPRQP
jgi:hypothetical protein